MRMGSHPRGFHVVIPLPLAEQTQEIPHPAGRPHCIPVLQTWERRPARSAIQLPQGSGCSDSVALGEYLTLTDSQCICVKRDGIDQQSMNLLISGS